MLIPHPHTITYATGHLTVPAGSPACGPALLHHIFPGHFCGGAVPLLTVSTDDSLPPEGYTIAIGERIAVTAHPRGVAPALWTLAGLAEPVPGGLRFPCCTLSDAPLMPFRGVHFYLPPSYGVEEFCRILDVLSRLHYNAVILEIGGGLEYDSHPEINAAWRKFCREARDYPGGPQGLQASEAYWKDSTHVELANSDALTKAELRRIADHCELLGLELIPEIQGLSHAYYLTLAHPEIAERPFERWPDSWCPSCEESYSLYFDVASEILDLLQPKRVSIGHDEVRILGECPRCRGKSGHELLAGDINRLYDFYAARGVGVMMWGEKLQALGGREEPERVDRYGRRYRLPATNEAASMIPKDILMLDWHYAQTPDSEREFEALGFQEIFGNFEGSRIADWPRRSAAPNVLGGEVSTWCVSTEYEMGFNGWFEELAFSAMVLWERGYDDDRRDAFRRRADAFLPVMRGMIRGREAFDGTLSSLAKLALPEGTPSGTAEYVGGTLDADLAAVLAGTGLRDGEAFTFAPASTDALVFFHAVDDPPARFTSWTFRDHGTLIPARYAVEYDDGLCVTFDVDLGINAGVFASDAGYIRPKMSEIKSLYIDDLVSAADIPAPTCRALDPWRDAAVYFTRYADFRTPAGPRTVYAYEWPNPHPGHAVTRVRVVREEMALRARLFAVGVL